jgi:cytochrome c oxidase subunit 2
MKHVKIYILVVVAALVLAGCSHNSEKVAPTGTSSDETTAPQDQATGEGLETAPYIIVGDQPVIEGKVVIASVTSLTPGFVVVHADDNGNPGAVLGYTVVSSGTSPQVEVAIDITKQTPILYAMLHEDTGVQGTFEFPADDKPVMVSNTAVTMPFNIVTDMEDSLGKPITDVTGETNTAGEVQSFTITARKWEFEPSTITVKKGNTVKLSITSVDVEHGFGLPEFGINKTIEAGETVDVEFVADKVGEFPFSCTVYCGEGHKDMKGTLVVTE